MKTLKITTLSLLLSFFLIANQAFGAVSCDLYVDSAGDNSDGLTWAKAFNTLDTAFDNENAGDVICVSHDSTSTYAANTTYDSAGTLASPVIVISVNQADDTYTTGAIEDADGGSYDLLTSLSSHTIIYGVHLKHGDDLDLGGNSSLTLIDCEITNLNNSKINASSGTLRLYNTTVNWGGTGCQIVGGGASIFTWHGGTMTGDPNVLFDTGANGQIYEIRGVDLSSMTGGYFFEGVGATIDEPGTIGKIHSCKLHATPPTIVDEAVAIDGGVFEVVNSHSGAVPYFEYEYPSGNIYLATNSYLDGTYDGTNGYSAKFTSNANASYHRPLCHRIADLKAGANPTLTVRTLTDNITLQDDEFWIEIEGPDATVAAYRTWDRDSKMALGGTAANLTDDSGTSTWTEDLTNDVEQRIDESVTGAAGIYSVWGCVGRASITVYVDTEVDDSTD